MEVGCYTLDIYCDCPLHTEITTGVKFKIVNPKQYTGQTLQECRKKALKAGWIFHHNKRQTCIRCITEYGYSRCLLYNETYGGY